MNGQPSPGDIAKLGAAGDGVGEHEHGGTTPHGHGEPSFSDAEVELLESRGLHVDRFHGVVYSPSGTEETPLHIAAVLHEARERGVLKVGLVDIGSSATPMVAEGDGRLASGPGESAPVVKHLDLRA